MKKLLFSFLLLLVYIICLPSLAYASAEFENEISYFTFYSSYVCSVDSMEDAGISLYESDPESDAATVGGSMVLDMSFSFVYSPSDKKVSGFEAHEITRRYFEKNDM